ncbi:extracellular solute-binding protein [Ancylobacter sp. A5.8]|uniref:extracellular solute-binding protein n=1 Tax=Ancylobacter gelatini TaxID=2919920 RepID=UPI001F4D6D0C|nr:extracellular solute-binding protein [Ancylobacter gelatini]MCJ8142323.1 extracellular solute-binding protein [Ancylobacter gelatini]
MKRDVLDRGLLASRKTVLALSMVLISSVAQADTVTGTLNVYSVNEEPFLAEFMPVFKAKYPELKVNVIHGSGGPVLARVLAEKSNPQADVILSLPGSSLVILQKQGLLDTYKTTEAEHLKPHMTDREPGGPQWTPVDAFGSAICFNKAEAEARNAPTPTKWSDLTSPAYKGQIVMPNPASSGTGLLMVANWFQLLGEEGAWSYMDKLHENVAQYLHSGSAPCRMAASGEAIIGLSYPNIGVQSINAGAPLAVILPEEGNGAEIEGNAILKGAKNVKAAKLLIDFMATEDAQKIAGKYYAVLARKGVASTTAANYPTNEEEKMNFFDYNWLAANKDRILAEWQKRYGGKSAPKK